MLNREHRKEIEQALGMYFDDKYKVRFFYHKVPDLECESIREAIQKADEKAMQLSQIKKEYVKPDYTPENLKRLGAKQEYKTELYIELRRINAKDYRSRKATDEDKIRFEKEYQQFISENKHDNNQQQAVFHERQPSLRISENRQDNEQTGTGYEFSYSFTL